MKSGYLVLTERFSSREGPDREAVRRAVELWLAGELGKSAALERR